MGSSYKQRAPAGSAVAQGGRVKFRLHSGVGASSIPRAPSARSPATFTAHKDGDERTAALETRREESKKGQRRLPAGLCPSAPPAE